jgi:cation diffusion facilitator family transporter
MYLIYLTIFEKQNWMNPKVKVARLSIASNTFLIIMKLSVGIISGSVSIISEAIHSSMDLLAALIAYFSVKVSDNPPDSNHPYGHEKFENISGVIEALLIFAAAILIITEAIKKLTGKPFELEIIWIGSLAMLVSSLVNSIVSCKLKARPVMVSTIPSSVKKKFIQQLRLLSTTTTQKFSVQHSKISLLLN